MEPSEDAEYQKYQKEQFENYRRLKKAEQDLNEMMQDYKKLTPDGLKLKYGKPQREFALLQWELHKAKRGMHDKYDTAERRAREADEKKMGDV